MWDLLEYCPLEVCFARGGLLGRAWDWAVWQGVIGSGQIDYKHQSESSTDKGIRVKD